MAVDLMKVRRGARNYVVKLLRSREAEPPEFMQAESDLIQTVWLDEIERIAKRIEKTI